MAMTKDEVHNIAAEIVASCRADVNKEIKELRDTDKQNAWTETRAKEIAAEAASLAVRQITDNFYLSIGKKTVASVGVVSVAVVFWFQEHIQIALKALFK